MGGNRFWEFYLVRYLLGTIFGIVILFFLVSNYNSEITTNFYPKVQNANIKDDIQSLLFNTTYGVKVEDANVVLEAFQVEAFFNDSEVKKDSEGNEVKICKDYIEIKQTGFPILAAIILAIAGFLYMYFSSMLILILHGVRSILFFYPPASKSKYTIHIFFVVFFFILFCILLPIFLFRPDVGDNGKHFFSLSILVVFWGLFLLSSSLIQQFYIDLSLFRTKDEKRQDKYKKFKFFASRNGLGVNHVNLSNEEKQSDTKDYIESYKHLREHGNAFGIIVCELIFAFWLIFWEFSFWSIFYWCLFGFTAWTLGTYLEINRVRSHTTE